MAFSYSEHSGDGREAASAHAQGGTQAAFIMAAEVGRFFQDLRRALRLSEIDAARRLATRPDILAALETGNIGGLPPWPETCRIVRTYTGFAGLDPRPVLFSLEQLRGAAMSAPAARRGSGFSMPRMPDLMALKQSVSALARMPRRAPAPVPAPAPAARPAYQPEPAAAPRRQHQHQTARRVLFGLSLPVALLMLLTQTSVLEAAVSRMPSPMARFVRGAQEYIAVKMAPVRNGMRWIEVDDPRSRRGDKLQTAAQSD